MKKLLLILLLPLILINIHPARAHADTQDFVIHNFSADYYLTNDDKQGSLHIVEKIDLTFNDYNHGILRAIPKKYKNSQLKLKINSVKYRSVQPAKYTTYSENGNTVLKIGDPTTTITGPQSYEIDYTLQNVISFYETYDELYWDINGDEWQQKFEKVSVRLHLPTGLKLGNNETLCYAGFYGSIGNECSVTTNGNVITVSTNVALDSYETLSVVVGFEKGYFAVGTWYERVQENAGLLALILGVPLVVGGFAFRHWHKNGRDPKGRGTIVPEYEAPDGLSPIEVGTLTDFKTDNSDVTATIIDLAVRGYIKIIEEKKKKIGKDKLTYTLEVVNKDLSQLNAYEAKLIRELFGFVEIGKQVKLEDFKNKFSQTAETIRKNVGEDLTKSGYFNKNPHKASFLLSAGGALFLAVFSFGRTMGGAASVGLILAALPCLVFGILMPSRTLKGVLAKEKILGLKLYLETAEKDRIKMLQSPDAAYASDHEAPKKTVNLFEKLLPYAMVLGVEKKWAEQFKDIYQTPPQWYSGNWTTFNAALLVSNISGSMAAATNVAFSAPRSSGSSGFGGGGFSGGGGGGGGGGGW